ncbi:MAG: TIR domain-containing protein [Vicinamibacterales bacterium]
MRPHGARRLHLIQSRGRQRPRSSLEADLQRFAKPWYQIRALRIFRDASNLNLSPNLWSGISEALASASHVIYLASPQAAASKWVEKEVEYWLTNRDVARLIIVVTDGDISWDDPSSDFDWERTTCMPRSASGRFSGVPFYLDLRWARRSTDLSLQNPRFKDAVALLAATLHGKSVEDMIGEEVVQHRRTTRIRNLAIGALATLFLAASVAAVVAVRQRTEAFQQRDRAVQSSLLNRVRGELERDSLMTAVQTARESRRRFGATSVVQQTLLEAAGHPTSILTTMREPLDSQPRVVFSPDGAQILSLAQNGVASYAARLRDWRGREQRTFDEVYLARYAGPTHLLIGWPWAQENDAEEDGSWCHNKISAPPVTDYGLVKLQRLDLRTTDSKGVDLPVGFRDATADDRLRVSLCGNYVRLDDGSGRRVGHLRIPGVSDAAFSPDGTRLAVATAQRTSLYDVSRGVDLASVHLADVTGTAPVFSPDAQLIATVDGAATIVSDMSGRERLRHPGVSPVFGPHNLMATVSGTETLLWTNDAAEPQRLAGRDPRFSSDGQWVMTTVDEKLTRIADVGGHELVTLDAVSGQFAQRAPVVLTATASGLVRLHDLRRAAISSPLAGARLWSVPAATLEALAVAPVICVRDCAFPDGAARVSVSLLAVTPGEPGVATIRISPGSSSPSPTASSPGRAGGPTCSGSVAPLEFSPGANGAVAVGCGNGALLVHDENGALRWQGTHDRAITHARFSHDGRELLTASADRSARIWDGVRGGELARFPGHESEVVDAIFSPAADRVATVTARGTLRIWVRSGSTWSAAPVFEVSVPDDVITSAVFGADNTHVFARTRRGLLHRWVLDGDLWLQEYDWVESPSSDELRELGLSQ